MTSFARSLAGFEPPDPGVKLVVGFTAIGEFLDITPGHAKRLIEDGVLPAFRLGRRWAARPEALRATIEVLEARASGAGVPPPPPPEAEPTPEKRGRRRAV